MKKLNNDLFTKPLALFSGFVVFLFLLSFVLFEQFTQELILSSNLDKSQVMHDFYSLWFAIALVCLTLYLALFGILRSIKKKFNKDLAGLTIYLHEISSKKRYNSPLQINHYIEFLHISIVLKNIIKRLHNKHKKK